MSLDKSHNDFSFNFGMEDRTYHDLTTNGRQNYHFGLLGNTVFFSWNIYGSCLNSSLVYMGPRCPSKGLLECGGHSHGLCLLSSTHMISYFVAPYIPILWITSWHIYMLVHLIWGNKTILGSMVGDMFVLGSFRSHLSSDRARHVQYRRIQLHSVPSIGTLAA